MNLGREVTCHFPKLCTQYLLPGSQHATLRPECCSTGGISASLGKDGGRGNASQDDLPQPHQSPHAFSVPCRIQQPGHRSVPVSSPREPGCCPPLPPPRDYFPSLVETLQPTPCRERFHCGSVDSVICEDPVLASICKRSCEFETVTSCSLSGDSYCGDNAVRFFTTKHSREWVSPASTTHPRGLADAAYIPPVRHYSDHPEWPCHPVQTQGSQIRASSGNIR